SVPALVLGGLVAAVALLILGEIIPRTLALRDPAASAEALAPTLALAVWLLRPLIALIRGVGRAFGTRVAYPGVASEDEVPFLPAEVEPGWGADRAETQMIAGIIDLEETTAREVMVPRIDIVAAPVDASIEAVADLVIARGFSRIPAYNGSLDDVVGIVYAKDI